MVVAGAAQNALPLFAFAKLTNHCKSLFTSLATDLAGAMHRESANNETASERSICAVVVVPFNWQIPFESREPVGNLFRQYSAIELPRGFVVCELLR